MVFKDGHHQYLPPVIHMPLFPSRDALCFPSPGNFPDPGIEPRSPALQILYHLSHQGISSCLKVT